MRFHVVVLTFWLVSTGLAWAQPDEARRLHAEGKAHYDRGAFTDAIAAWKASYRLVQAPRLLWNIGQAYRQAGDCPHALHFYARYQQADAKPANAAELSQALALCKDAQPSSDDGDAPAVVEPVTEPVIAPTIAPTITPAITPATSTPRVTLPAAPSTATRRRSSRRTAGLVMMSGGILGGAASVYFAKRAVDLAGDVERGSGEWDVGAQARDADGRRARNAAIGLGAASLVAISAGALLWWSGRSREPQPRVGLTLTPDVAAVEVSCAF